MSRRTVSFKADEIAILHRYADETSDQHRVLVEIIHDGQPRSESALLRALVLIGMEVVEERILEEGYNRAVDAGEFDNEAALWADKSMRTAASVWAAE